MQTLGLVVAFGMPLAIFLFAGWKLAVRLHLGQHGLVTEAVVTSVRDWLDSMDGIKHQTVSYQFPVGDHYQSSSVNVPVRGKGYTVGDRLPVIYLPSRPAKVQPVTGGPATSVGLTVVVMVAMVALMLWLPSLLHL